MPPRIQPRRIARELALLSLSQIRAGEMEQPELNKLVLAAIRTLTTEVQDTLETAAAEVKRSSDRLLSSETRASNLTSAKAMVGEAVELTQAAINRLGVALELPEVIQLSNQPEVRQYAVELIKTVRHRQQDIEKTVEAALVDWQFNRLPRIDRDILRIAVAEMMFLGVKEKIAINEAVELAKRYSDEEGYRFINGVLRRVTQGMASQGRS